MYQINNNIKQYKLSKIGDIKICGYSKSAFRTGYVLLPYNIYFDAGLPSPYNPNLILISHGHFDHIASLYSLLIEGNKCPVMISQNSINPIQNMLNSFKLLDGKNGIFNNWAPIVDNNIIIIINNQKFRIDTFKLDHSVCCNGYGLSIIKNKLKDEYKNIPSNELSKIKKEHCITYEETTNLILYIHDTGYKSLNYLPFDKYELVIIECTFISDDYDEAIKRKHLHWNDLEPYIKNNVNTQFLLGHFSSRYKEEELIEFKNKINILYKNVDIII
jgi:ribonuclease BN (tRNA processing enzyme)